MALSCGVSCCVLLLCDVVLCCVIVASCCVVVLSCYVLSCHLGGAGVVWCFVCPIALLGCVVELRGVVVVLC